MNHIRNVELMVKSEIFIKNKYLGMTNKHQVGLGRSVN
jgi:hypothetical protein